ncbi:Rne/Rng family ribonuclease [Reyranella sp.]|uniref:Rne/Rng family ribonuclease n=1 Tax=Reyranella sp. TaxID=1929291 RepID=UPI003BA8E50C
MVVVDGTRLEEFDFETASRKPLKGNIYLAKVIRIEPSLQAAFVEYGGNRHGFLAFSEIHPDYYQIPVADRERLIAEQQRLNAEADEDEPRRPDRIDRTDIEEVREEKRAEIGLAEAEAEAPPVEAAAEAVAGTEDTGDKPVADEPADALPTEAAAEAPSTAPDPLASPAAETAAGEPEPFAPPAQPAAIVSERLDGPVEETAAEEPAEPSADQPATVYAEAAAETPVELPAGDAAEAPQPEVTVETLGGDDVIEQRETRERRRRNPIRQYKIQEVIKRRQILLVQVVKEERGNKGAALTTYLSLAGRYSVLMPNAGRGGGISRKISNPADRKRMKEVLGELAVPQGMGVILRTAGLERATTDIKRDYEYLSRLWDSIREITMRSTAPALIYEEGDLIKRSLRDVYDTDIAQVLVEGEDGYEAAAAFMRQLVPHQAAKVELYKEPIPLFHRYQVESQFDAMHSPVVQLRSGGYIVINPTEALVAIDVNSGRSTKERNIEETAVRTNVEAAEEIARQVRLRDLAGLIVIDFIDMEETRHQRQVEHKVKDAMRHDRARIQIGRISAFGLLEMSRQRLRPSLLEHSTETCPHCAGTGRVRSIESAALHALRAIEEEGVRRRASEIVVSVPPTVALYLLNQKRHTLSEIEKRYGFNVAVEADDELHAADCEIERVRSRRDDRERPAQELARATYDEVSDEAAAEEIEAEDTEAGGERAEGEDGDRDGGRRRRRRRRRRGRRDGEEPGEQPQAMGAEDSFAEGGPEPASEDTGDEDREPAEEAGEAAAADGEKSDLDAEADGERGDRRRRRGRRGGRRRRRENGEGDMSDHVAHEAGDDHAGEGSTGEEPTGEGPAGEEATGDDAPAAERPAAAEPAPSVATPMEAMPAEVLSGDQPPVDEAPLSNGIPIAPAAMAAEAPVVALAPEPPVAASAPQPEPAPVVPAITAPPEKPKRGWWRR